MNLMLIHYFEGEYGPDQGNYPVVYPSIEGLKEGIQIAIEDCKKKIDGYKAALGKHLEEMEKLDTSAYVAATKIYWDLVFERNNRAKSFEEKFDLEEKIKNIRREVDEEYAKLPAPPARPDHYLFSIGDARIYAEEEANMDSFKILTLEEWFTMSKSTPVFLK